MAPEQVKCCSDCMSVIPFEQNCGCMLARRMDCIFKSACIHCKEIRLDLAGRQQYEGAEDHMLGSVASSSIHSLWLP